MPHKATYLRKGYLENLVKNYDHNNSHDLADFSRNIGINITTIRAVNNGKKVQIKTTIKKIANYFNIKPIYIEHSVLNKKDLMKFHGSYKPKNKNIPEEMLEKNKERHNG